MIRHRSFAHVWLFAALCLPLASPAATLPRAHAVPGGIAVIALPPPITRASYQGHRVMVLMHAGRHYAVVGIPLGTPTGRQVLNAHLDGHPQTITFEVMPKHYAVQRLTIRNKAMVTLSQADLARVKRERKRIDAVYDHWTPTRHACLPFSLPVRGVETSPFGVQRILNGKPRAPHSGIDIAARAGTPVHAPAAGVVALVGHFFFNGRTVIIDHGQGLVSVYVHLSKIMVHPGQHVRRGEIIANVGSSGRTTGADLHWTVTLNGSKIDPELLLSPSELTTIQAGKPD